MSFNFPFNRQFYSINPFSLPITRNNSNQNANTFLEALSQNSTVSTVFPSLTSSLLENFSFSLNDVERVFQAADSFRTFQGLGNNELTQVEISYYLNYSRESLKTTPKAADDLLILLLLDRFFDHLSEFESKSGFSLFKVLPFQTLQAVAKQDGNSQDFTAQDVQLYIAQLKSGEIPVGQNALTEITQLSLNAEEQVIRSDAPLKALPKDQRMPPKIMQKVSATMEASNSEHQNLDKLPPEIMDRISHFNFSLEEILTLIQARNGQIYHDDLMLSKKIIQSQVYDLERWIQLFAESSPLKEKLKETRRSQSLIQMLMNNFSDIASLDGRAESISLDDVHIMIRNAKK